MLYDMQDWVGVFLALKSHKHQMPGSFIVHIFRCCFFISLQFIYINLILFLIVQWPVTCELSVEKITKIAKITIFLVLYISFLLW